MVFIPIPSTMFSTAQVPASNLFGPKERQVAGRTRHGAEAYCKVCKDIPIPFQLAIEMPVKCSLQNEESQTSSGCKDILKRENPRRVLYSSQPSSNEKQLRALHSYFQKLQNGTNQFQTSFMASTNCDTLHDNARKKHEPPSLLSHKGAELLDELDQLSTEKGLSLLDNYLGKFDSAEPPENVGSTSDYKKREEDKMNSYVQPASKNDENSSENSQGLQPYDETSDIYLVCILTAINIAVFLFEIATPVRNSEVELLTLPSLYGAKINQLILVGEWWRLVTPMFLHHGILHVALGCWVLLNFGPQVSKGYGSLTFLLIYILGGISGNLTSFIHTPDPTVGGTGPAFAIIGAWFMYQLQNKAAISKEVVESMFQKAVIATTLSFVISSFGPIDDWTHLGAACAGIAYGFVTCPTLQLGNAPSRTSQEDGIALVRRNADPCKAVIIFIGFIVVLGSLVLVLQHQSDEFEFNSIL